MESRENRRQPRKVLANILFAGSMLWMLLCIGCKTIGRELSMPGTLGGQSTELKGINGRLYDHLQILLWVGRNNYGGSYPEKEKCGPENDKPGNPDLKNRDPSIVDEHEIF
ncbi:MAG: hypothetical protein LBB16_02690 [Puniceicoccales bacterium]|nr:hypothetical protein [Puniceicoccales bacterium]